MTTSRWNVDALPDLSGQVAVVTGANAGLGYYTTRALAGAGAHVVMASRNQDKAEAARARMLEDMPDATIDIGVVDLADLESIARFAEDFGSDQDRLDLLINNAGIMMVPKGTTTDGFERQFGTNHLGHFALTGRLFPLLRSTPGARVVTVSSIAHKSASLDFDDLMTDRGYQPMKAYGRSKLANLLFAFELQRRSVAAEADVASLAAHPGVSATELGDHLLGGNPVGKLLLGPIKLMSRLVLSSAEDSCRPTLRAATDPQAKGGDYFGPAGVGEVRGRPTRVDATSAARSEADASRLWEVSESLTGVSFL